MKITIAKPEFKTTENPKGYGTVGELISEFLFGPFISMFAAFCVSFILTIVFNIIFLGIIPWIFTGTAPISNDTMDATFNFIARPLVGVSFIGAYVVIFCKWFVTVSPEPTKE